MTTIEEMFEKFEEDQKAFSELVDYLKNYEDEDLQDDIAYHMVIKIFEGLATISKDDITKLFEIPAFNWVNDYTMDQLYQNLGGLYNRATNLGAYNLLEDKNGLKDEEGG